MLQYTIHSVPTPNKATRFTKRGFAYNPNKKDIEQIRWQLKPYAPEELLNGRLEVFYTFYMPIPKSTSSIRKRQMLNDVLGMTKRPDFDNLAYKITNAMKGIIYTDDSIITDAHIFKRWSDRPRTEIKIIPINQMEKASGDKCE